MIKLGILFFIFILVAGCSEKIEPLNYGTDQCAYCKMTLSDKKFGAEILNDKGKAVKFDAVECLLRYSAEKNIDDNVCKIFVIDYSEPSKLVDAKNSFFLTGSKISSPMGEGICAFEKTEIAQQFMQRQGGRIFNWNELKNEIK